MRFVSPILKCAVRNNRRKWTGSPSSKTRKCPFTTSWTIWNAFSVKFLQFSFTVPSFPTFVTVCKHVRCTLREGWAAAEGEAAVVADAAGHAARADQTSVEKAQAQGARRLTAFVRVLNRCARSVALESRRSEQHGGGSECNQRTIALTALACFAIGRRACEETGAAKIASS